MWTAKRIAVAAVVLGLVSGGAAWAAHAASSSPSSSPSAEQSAGPLFGRHKLGVGRLGDHHPGFGRRALFCHLTTAEAGLFYEGALHHIRLDRGIAQSVSPSAIVLKELDGTMVNVPVDDATRVRVNGEAASISDVKDGFTVFAVRETGHPARAVRAFDASSFDPCQKLAGGQPGSTGL